MPGLYKNLRKTDIKNAAPGYATNALLIPISWIDTFGEPVGTLDVGSTVIISDSHIMKTDKAAIAVYCQPKTTEGNGELVGEAGARRHAWKPKIIIPGDSPQILEMVKNLVNEDFILLIKDSACGTEEYIQFGCDCDPCEVETAPFLSGTTGTGRKQYELTMLTYCKFFYQGNIAELVDGDEEPA